LSKVQRPRAATADGEGAVAAGLPAGEGEPPVATGEAATDDVTGAVGAAAVVGAGFVATWVGGEVGWAGAEHAITPSSATKAIDRITNIFVIVG